MIKLLKKYQVQLTPFEATKNWTLNNIDNNDVLLTENDEVIALEFIDYGDGSSGPFTNSFCDISLEQQEEDATTLEEGLKVSGIFYESSDPINIDKTYKRNIYHQIKTTFYNTYLNPTKLWGIENIDFELSKTKRKLSDQFNLVNVPRRIFGNRIVPTTINFTDNTSDNNYTITDDGNGNLFAGTNIFSRQQEIGNYSNYFLVGASSFCNNYWSSSSINTGSIDTGSLSTPNMTLGINSNSGSIIVEWTQASEPDENEIWKNINGGSFSLYTTIDGANITYTDTGSGMVDGDVWCYKVRGKTGANTSSFSDVSCAVKQLFFPSGSSSLPTWVMYFGDFGSEDITLVTDMDFSRLKRVRGNLFLDAAFLLTGISLDALERIDNSFMCSVGFDITTLNLPVLSIVSGSFYADQCTSLTDVNIPNLIFRSGSVYAFDSSGLSATSVNHILARAVASSVTSCSIFLDSGTNAAPTGQGIIDKATLIAAGNIVSSN